MNNENWRITGERMQERLKALNMTQRELAEKTGKTEVTISRWANSERIPLATEYTGLSKALKCTCDYLLGLSEDPSKTSKQEEQKNIDEQTTKILKEWIYADLPEFGEEAMKQIEKVEEAIGFKLFSWQKRFIISGIWRRTGETTAEILRDLLNVDAPPIDYTREMYGCRGFYQKELLRIKEKLDRYGIKTREVFLTIKDRQEHEQQKRG